MKVTMQQNTTAQLFIPSTHRINTFWTAVVTCLGRT